MDDEMEREEESLDAAIHGLRRLQGNAWLFVCDPKRHQLGDDTYADDIEHWPVEVYRDHIEFGDPAVFWMSGREAGVYAVGQVAGALFEKADRWECPLDLYVDLFEVPIRKAELLADARFVDAPILRTPHADSPHLLTTEHLAAILDLAVVPYWARSGTAVARRVATLIREEVEAAAVDPLADLPLIEFANDEWARTLDVSEQQVREALNELFFLTKEKALSEEALGFTFNTARRR